jgi:outer membrane protein OmpA-like peptidoglycan-associated protein
MGVDTFAKSILFNSNRASFKSGISEQLDGMIGIMNKYPKSEFDIKGYTDNTGTNAYNLMLSNKRANAVKDYLVEKGVQSARLTAKGFGEASPADSNRTKSGRANNRRVEVKLTN